MTETLTYKIALVGRCKSGKTSIIKSFLHNTFDKQYDPTIEDHYTTTISLPNGKTVKLEIFDTSGNEDYQDLQSYYINEVDGFLMVYETLNQKSLRDLEKFAATIHSNWVENNKNSIQDGKQQLQTRCPMVFVENKSDLYKRRLQKKVSKRQQQRKSIKAFDTQVTNDYALLQQMINDSEQGKTDKTSNESSVSSDSRGSVEDESADPYNESLNHELMSYALEKKEPAKGCTLDDLLKRSKQEIQKDNKKKVSFFKKISNVISSNKKKKNKQEKKDNEEKKNNEEKKDELLNESKTEDKRMSRKGNRRNTIYFANAGSECKEIAQQTVKARSRSDGFGVKSYQEMKRRSALSYSSAFFIQNSFGMTEYAFENFEKNFKGCPSNTNNSKRFSTHLAHSLRLSTSGTDIPNEEVETGQQFSQSGIEYTSDSNIPLYSSFYKVSSKTGQNIAQSFHSLVMQIYVLKELSKQNNLKQKEGVDRVDFIRDLIRKSNA